MLSSFFQKIISPIKEDFEAKKVLFTEDHEFLDFYYLLQTKTKKFSLPIY